MIHLLKRGQARLCATVHGHHLSLRKVPALQVKNPQIDALAWSGSFSTTSDGYCQSALIISKHLRYRGEDGVKTRNKRFVNLFRTCSHFVLQSGTFANNFDFADLMSAGATDEDARR